MKVVIEMIQTNKINPEDLKIIRNTDKFKIEEIGNKETGEIHNEMFIDGLLLVDEIIYAVKKFDARKVWYRVGANKTHTFPLIIKMRDSNYESELDNFGDVEFSFPTFHKTFWNGKERRHVYNHSI